MDSATWRAVRVAGALGLALLAPRPAAGAIVVDRVEGMYSSVDPPVAEDVPEFTFVGGTVSLPAELSPRPVDDASFTLGPASVGEDGRLTGTVMLNMISGVFSIGPSGSEAAVWEVTGPGTVVVTGLVSATVTIPLSLLPGSDPAFDFSPLQEAVLIADQSGISIVDSPDRFGQLGATYDFSVLPLAPVLFFSGPFRIVPAPAVPAPGALALCGAAAVPLAGWARRARTRR